MAETKYVKTVVLKQVNKEEKEKMDAAKSSRPLAIVGFILAILMIVANFFSGILSYMPLIGTLISILSWFGPIVYIVAIVLCAIAIGKAKKGGEYPGASQGKGLGTAGLIIAIIGLVLEIISFLIMMFILGVIVIGGIAAIILFVVLGSGLMTEISAATAAIALLFAL